MNYNITQTRDGLSVLWTRIIRGLAGFPVRGHKGSVGQDVRASKGPCWSGRRCANFNLHRRAPINLNTYVAAGLLRNGSTNRSDVDEPHSFPESIRPRLAAAQIHKTCLTVHLDHGELTLLAGCSVSCEYACCGCYCCLCTSCYVPDLSYYVSRYSSPFAFAVAELLKSFLLLLLLFHYRTVKKCTSTACRTLSLLILSPCAFASPKLPPNSEVFFGGSVPHIARLRSRGFQEFVSITGGGFWVTRCSCWRGLSGQTCAVSFGF